MAVTILSRASDTAASKLGDRKVSVAVQPDGFMLGVPNLLAALSTEVLRSALNFPSVREDFAEIRCRVNAPVTIAGPTSHMQLNVDFKLEELCVLVT